MYSSAVQLPRRAGVFLLVGGLDQVHVHGGVVLGRGVRQQGQRLVGAPVQVGRGELDLHPALVVVLRMEALEHVHRVVEAHLEAVEPALHGALQLLGQAAHELLVGLVDEPVLVAHGVAVADAHADILVGADGLAGALLDVAEHARHPALDVLHRGDARADHLEGRVERVEIEVEVADHHAGDEPELQRHVGRAELHRRQADMVMAVDEARQQDLLAAADDGDGRVLSMQVVVGADGRDDAVLLQHGAVLDLVPGEAVLYAGDGGAAADETGGQCFLLTTVAFLPTLSVGRCRRLTPTVAGAKPLGIRRQRRGHGPR